MSCVNTKKHTPLSFFATKDPEEKLDYGIDWTAELESSEPPDSISTSIWETSGGLAITTPAIDGNVTTVWVTPGGKLGAKTRLTNRIETVAGRVYDRTIELTIQRK